MIVLGGSLMDSVLESAYRLPDNYVQTMTCL